MDLIKETKKFQNYFADLQKRITTTFTKQDSTCKLIEDNWQEHENRYGKSCVLQPGNLIESAAINVSYIREKQLPAAATLKRPALRNSNFVVTGISVICHPKNPYAPTSHLNLRIFAAFPKDAEAVWWTGGGFDLTPYYGFKEDCRYWHNMAKDACDKFDKNLYADFKKRCDDYFFLPHRNETRGIGGIFFDDFKLNEPSCTNTFDFIQAIGETYLTAYSTILEKRIHTPFTKQQRDFQLYRRGRYVEFNLLHDRGTLFGLQSNGRTESILSSMPPKVIWKYNWHPQQNSEEAKLYTEFLRIQDWVNS
ncbi:MAG: oxygen-dependent coproporphyrinogen oxidase [Thiotrichales bacterium]|nr:MAG: oxygen-dependent coproporphyrinogen oxidase [Thiotrichales bacterium]